MKALVTGATGFVGFHVARLLIERGFKVKALVRYGTPAWRLEALGVEVVRGDINDEGKLCRALKDCAHLYHAAADYRLWVPDPAAMYRVNVEGTGCVMRAALEAQVERVVYTSTVGVLKAGHGDTLSDENDVAARDRAAGHYKRSKLLAEEVVLKFAGRGLPAVIVNPSTPIGAFDAKPTPTGAMIVDFLNKRIPAYLDTGLNFVDVEDVAAGHLSACEKGRTGERYILGNRNMSLRDFFRLLAGISGSKPPKVRLPYYPVLAAACACEFVSRITGAAPRIPLDGVRMAARHMYFDPAKAIRELGLPQTPIERAAEKAVRWFEENGYIGARL